ncbi:acid phosphatase [Telmatospirillum siberiense]|uniref:Acid phosphatase n=1 Tax=Telmatospirillum siberiense TaxID=382514 RepID=A0A2N3PT76_9PROT|nr:phosphatase PAP2 family protein [Telmatospirillum siberiense]PKU23604.1 phosphatidic acid phosphatase [Telmatospirillum siberiense]
MKRLQSLVWPALVALTVLLPAGAGAKEGKQGYLAPDAVEIFKILPPAPREGEARYQADREIFKATRRFAGTARWTLATSDVKLSTADMLGAYSCAVGVTLTPETAPHLVHVIETAGADTSGAAGVAKDHFKRLRPFLIDEGQVCQSAADLSHSYDYPSGHTTRGWTWAELLAELAPDRAGAILARGRAFGESRIICGAHNTSAVEAGRLTAASVLAAVHGSPAFQADLKAAKEELDALRANAQTPQPQGCAEEARLVAEPVF